MSEGVDPLLLHSEEKREWSALITFHQQPCEIRYSASTDIVTINECNPSKDTSRVLLRIPSFLILNCESEEEAIERQRLRKTTDAAVMKHFSSGMTEFKVRSGKRERPVVDGKADIVYSHSHLEHLYSSSDCHASRCAKEGHLDIRSSSSLSHSTLPTDVDVSHEPSLHAGSCDIFHSPAQTPELSDAQSTSLNSLSGIGALKSNFFLHYVKIDPSGELRCIRSLQFKARRVIDFQRLHELMYRLLARVYEKSVKNILIFASPVSGTGEAEMVVRKMVLPVLHFSKHRVQVIVTKRAHHCEDYVADINNAINEHFVVVGVGGDGMVHEIVNGLHRRKLALLKNMRETQPENKGPSSSSSSASSTAPSVPVVTGRYPSEKDILRGWNSVMPLVATIPSGSGCGLAKSLDQVHPFTAVLGLIHCSTVVSDLLYMRFSPNPDLVDYHSSAMSKRERRRVESQFDMYEEQKRKELKAHREPTHDTAIKPFLSDGKERFDNPVSLHLGSPYYSERVAFMGFGCGLLNDVDRGSEHLRWMGNTRFSVYGCYRIICGPSKYNFKLRYLPWESKKREVVKKIHADDVLSTSIPICTCRSSCPHCAQCSGGGKREDRGVVEISNHSQRMGPENPSRKISSSTFTTRERRKRSAAVLDSNSDFLDEASVDFDDEALPWETIEGEMYLVSVCGIKDISRDIMMAPLAHLSDGGIDVVLCTADVPCGRKDFLQFFLALESGAHLSLPFVKYFRASALEISVEGGLIMADGEMMPMSRVRVTKLRRGVQYVRCDF